MSEPNNREDGRGLVNNNQNADWLERKRNILMLVTSLLATMAFQAGVNPPSGVWQDNGPTGFSSTESNGENHTAGFFVLADNHLRVFIMFLVCITTGFLAFLGIILLLINGLPFRHWFFILVLMVIILVAVSTMIGRVSPKISVEIDEANLHTPYLSFIRIVDLVAPLNENPLRIAAMKGDLGLLRELVQARPWAARVFMEQSETILQACVRCNRLEALKLLVDRVSDHEFVNFKNGYGNTILHLAMPAKQTEEEEIVESLERMECKRQAFVKSSTSVNRNQDLVVHMGSIRRDIETKEKEKRQED
ncbi:hypothetical protein V6N11_026781 [Hibiscus sabdariffa]|uniref:PGG domain-containing protein n=1 Tax=Hibiscus sabdariffa TaxID=183260 RepID=A0ABR2SXH4_9ROSI